MTKKILGTTHHYYFCGIPYLTVQITSDLNSDYKGRVKTVKLFDTIPILVRATTIIEVNQ